MIDLIKDFKYKKVIFLEFNKQSLNLVDKLIDNHNTVLAFSEDRMNVRQVKEMYINDKKRYNIYNFGFSHMIDNILPTLESYDLVIGYNVLNMIYKPEFSFESVCDSTRNMLKDGGDFIIDIETTNLERSKILNTLDEYFQIQLINENYVLCKKEV